MLSIEQSKEIVDIRKYPTPDVLSYGDTYMLGDSHGNALYLLYFFVKKNILIIDETSYFEFAKLYQRHEVTIQRYINNPSLKNKSALIQEIIWFVEILQKIVVNPEARRQQIKAVLFGDEICDRGLSDLLNVLLLIRVLEGQINLKILMSNHGLEFLIAFFRNKFEARLREEHQNSMINLRHIIKANIISKEFIQKIYNSTYSNCSIAVHLQVDPDNPRRLLFSTHAPVPFSAIEDVCRLFGITYALDNLNHCVEQINQRYQQIIQDPVLTQKYFQLSRGKDSLIYNPRNPLIGLVWSRMEDQNDASDIRRPRIIGANEFIYANGHHTPTDDEHRTYVFCLNGKLGMPSTFTGQLAVLTCKTSSVAPSEIPIEIAVEKTNFDDLLNHLKAQLPNKSQPFSASFFSPSKENTRDPWKQLHDTIMPLKLEIEQDQAVKDDQLQQAHRCFQYLQMILKANKQASNEAPQKITIKTCYEVYITLLYSTDKKEFHEKAYSLICEFNQTHNKRIHLIRDKSLIRYLRSIFLHAESFNFISRNQGNLPYENFIATFQEIDNTIEENLYVQVKFFSWGEIEQNLQPHYKDNDLIYIHFLHSSLIEMINQFRLKKTTIPQEKLVPLISVIYQVLYKIIENRSKQKKFEKILSTVNDVIQLGIELKDPEKSAYFEKMIEIIANNALLSFDVSDLKTAHSICVALKKYSQLTSIAIDILADKIDAEKTSAFFN